MSEDQQDDQSQDPAITHPFRTFAICVGFVLFAVFMLLKHH